MTDLSDPLFRDAVAALDSGDVAALERLLVQHPRLVRERAEGGEGYFARPYLLWFVAENPIRNERLPASILDVTRTIVQAAARESPSNLQEQLDGALGLVSTGRVPREQGVQLALIDLLVDAGARPANLHPVLAHRELAAAERLLQRGAPMTLTAAICTGRLDDAARLAPEASSEEKQAALAGAAVYGNPVAVRLVLAFGVDVSAYGPIGFHPHGTALHHAVDSGSLETVRILVEAGARLDLPDRIYQATPLGWAEHLGRAEIAAYLGAFGT